MTFIRIQKKIVDENQNIVGGIASIRKTIYDKNNKYRNKQITIEKLGQVLYLSNDKKRGIFNSPLRGIVEYDVTTNEFTRVEPNNPQIKDKNINSCPKVHTVFGDSYLLLEFLKDNGLLSLFREMFINNTDYERLLVHIIHDIMKDGSHITCDNYISKSFMSYLIPDVGISSLKSDSRFFQMMGNDDVKINFFKRFITLMRKHDKNFGRATYVDSTPLPNDIADNPFNALSVHGLSQASIQARLVLILDQKTGLPVWFEIIPGNILDLSTLRDVAEDVFVSLDVKISDYVLDAGYVSKNLIETFNVQSSKTLLARMPAKKGFPYKELYTETKDLFQKGKYQFKRGKYVYFGIQKNKKIFDTNFYEYVYLYHYNANKGFNDYLDKHQEDYDKLKNKDKDFRLIEDGYFILVSNMNKSPKEILEDYYGRIEIEMVFKTAKEYLKLLPLKKWNNDAVRGKILTDMINCIVYLFMRKELNLNDRLSIPDLIGSTQSLMCFKDNDNKVYIEYPNKKTKEYYKVLLNASIPSSIDINTYLKETLKID